MNPMRHKLSAAWDFCVMEVEENVKMWHDILDGCCDFKSSENGEITIIIKDTI